MIRSVRRAHAQRKAVGIATIAALVVGGYLGEVALYSSGSAVETPVVVAAAGDINSGAHSTTATATGNYIRGLNPDYVLTLGDEAYPDGTDSNFADFNNAWGSFKNKIVPSPGNHEYHTANGQGHFNYFFNGVNTLTTQTFAREIANHWLLISLDSETSYPPQLTWLQSVLASHADWHKVAFWHKPRYTGGSSHGDNTGMDAIWAALDGGKTDLVLSGHNHLFEVYGPMGAGNAVRAEGQGVREIVAGTGGAGLYSCTSHVGRQKCIDQNHGVLKLDLFSDHFAWEFHATDGPGSGTVLDSGSAPTRTNGVPPSSTTSSSTSSSTSTSTSTSSSTSTTTSTTRPNGTCTTTTRLTGLVTDSTNRVHLPPNGQVDATGYIQLGQGGLLNGTRTGYVNTIYDGPGCWSSGVVWGTWPSTATWDDRHHTGAYTIKNSAGSTISGATAVAYGDSFRADVGSQGFTFADDRAYYGTDDCVEADQNTGGTVARTICYSYVGYSAQGGPATGATVTLTDNIFWLYRSPTVFKGTAPGSGPWFKSDSNSPSFVLRGNVFRADAYPNHGDLKPPPKVTACTGNHILWGGAGAFPDAAAWLSRCPDTTFGRP